MQASNKLASGFFAKGINGTVAKPYSVRKNAIKRTIANWWHQSSQACILYVSPHLGFKPTASESPIVLKSYWL